MTTDTLDLGVCVPEATLRPVTVVSQVFAVLQAHHRVCYYFDFFPILN